MQGHVFLVALGLIPSLANANDHFRCTFNLKRGPQTQAFQLKQSLTVERNFISWPTRDTRYMVVTEGEIPFEVYMGWDKFTAKITYRHAIEKNDTGAVIRAAQWKCFESSIETIGGLEKFSCGDKHKTNDPFSDPTLRWRPAPIANNTPIWDEGHSFQESFSFEENLLTLNCSVEPTQL